MKVHVFVQGIRSAWSFRKKYLAIACRAWPPLASRRTGRAIGVADILALTCWAWRPNVSIRFLDSTASHHNVALNLGPLAPTCIETILAGPVVDIAQLSLSIVFIREALFALLDRHIRRLAKGGRNHAERRDLGPLGVFAFFRAQVEQL